MSASNGIGSIVGSRPVRASLTLSGVWTTIFLLPTFFQRLFIGGAEVASYDEYPGVALVAVGYLCHVFVIGQYLVVPSSNATTRFILERYIPLALVSLLHIWLLVLSTDVGATTGVLAIVRQMVWVLSCLVMVRFTEPQLLLTRLIQLTHFTFAVIALTYALYLVTDVPLQLILRGGVPRAQGLLTEPSAVGCLLAGYAALAVYERKWRRLLYAIGISILVNSVISVAGLVIGIACGAIQLGVHSQQMRRAAIVGLLLITPLAVVVVPPFSRGISESASGAMSFIETTPFAESPIYINIGERVLAAASLLDTGIEIVKSGDNDIEGGLFRFASVLLLFQEMQNSWRLFVGYGLGAHAQLMEAADRTLLDFGAVAFLVSSFGLIGGMGLFGWLVWTVSRTTERLAVYAAPFVAIISFNPAGGIHMYSVALLAAFLLSRIERAPSVQRARLG
jgi:hypothetical protein